MLNVLDRQEVLRGVREVRSGKVFTLGLPIAHPDGDLVWPPRTPTKHFVTNDHGLYAAGKREPAPGSGFEYADDAIFIYCHGTTQLDALGHIWYGDRLYNGYHADTTVGGLTRNSIEKVAERGIAGATVLLDVARYRGVDSLQHGEEVTMEDLRRTAERQGVTIQRHDMLLVRTGFYLNFLQGGMARYVGDGVNEPGITYTEEMARWFYELEIPLYGTDTMGNEQTFSSQTGTTQPVHPYLITRLGVTMLEMAWLEDLAADCQEDGQYRFLMTVGALKIVGGTGSPINPVVIK
jgi:kynurenine formamidase